MISPEREAEILRLHHAEKWPVGTIASQLHVHHSTVRRVLIQAGAVAAEAMSRPSIVDAFVPFIKQTLTQYPRLRASRLYTMVRERGYAGAPDYFRHIVARHRPRPPAEAYLRLRTLPGEQAQVDWGHFGKVVIGNAARPLMGFVMVLSYSRQIFLRFYLGAAMPSFLDGHVSAFAFFGGVPRQLLYDNLKSAVLERVGDTIRFHPMLLQLAAHYRYSVKPVAPARGNEKGRVERAIRYVRDAFFAARAFNGLDDLNRDALRWCSGDAAERPCPEDRRLTVRRAFAEEQPRLMPLSGDAFPCEHRLEVHVGKTPYARFDLNDYSVPHDYVRRTLTVLASVDIVRVLDGQSVIAAHQRSWDRAQQIENPAHIQELVAVKRKAREHRTLDHLNQVAPASREFIRIIAERGGNIGNHTWRLAQLLQRFTPRELDDAITAALDKKALHVGAVIQLLDKARADRNLPPSVRLPLADHPRAARVVVRQHPLDSYDSLRKDSADDSQK
jgi:transposase